MTQPERVQPLRPLVVGQAGRHHREGFHAAHQDRLAGRGELLRAILAGDDAAALHRRHGQPQAGGHVGFEAARANVHAGPLCDQDDVYPGRAHHLGQPFQPGHVFLALCAQRHGGQFVHDQNQVRRVFELVNVAGVLVFQRLEAPFHFSFQRVQQQGHALFLFGHPHGVGQRSIVGQLHPLEVNQPQAQLLRRVAGAQRDEPIVWTNQNTCASISASCARLGN